MTAGPNQAASPIRSASSPIRPAPSPHLDRASKGQVAAPAGNGSRLVVWPINANGQDQVDTQAQVSHRSRPTGVAQGRRLQSVRVLATREEAEMRAPASVPMSRRRHGHAINVTSCSVNRARRGPSAGWRQALAYPTRLPADRSCDVAAALCEKPSVPIAKALPPSLSRRRQLFETR